MDNSNYIPKKLNINNTKTENVQVLNKDLDLNNQNIFPDLDIKSKSKSIPIQNQSIDWKNISKDLENKPIIKELQKNEKKESIIQSPKSDTTDDNNTNNKINKTKSSFIDESGWTHIVKSKKTNYKEKKSKDNTEIDELIKTVISY